MADDKAKLTIFAFYPDADTSWQFGCERERTTAGKTVKPAPNRYLDITHLEAGILDSLDRLVGDGAEEISYEFYNTKGGVLDIISDARTEFRVPLKPVDVSRIDKAIKNWYSKSLRGAPI